MWLTHVSIKLIITAMDQLKKGLKMPKGYQVTQSDEGQTMQWSRETLRKRKYAVVYKTPYRDIKIEFLKPH